MRSRGPSAGAYTRIAHRDDLEHYFLTYGPRTNEQVMLDLGWSYKIWDIARGDLIHHFADEGDKFTLVKERQASGKFLFWIELADSLTVREMSVDRLLELHTRVDFDVSRNKTWVVATAHLPMTDPDRIAAERFFLGSTRQLEDIEIALRAHGVI
jgi:hypothetical protein